MGGDNVGCVHLRDAMPLTLPEEKASNEEGSELGDAGLHLCGMGPRTSQAAEVDQGGEEVSSLI